MRKTRRCLAFLFSAFLFISPAFSTTLPSGYTELEYLRGSTTNEYIEDTTLLNNSNSGAIEIKVDMSTNRVGRFVGWSPATDSGTTSTNYTIFASLARGSNSSKDVPICYSNYQQWNDNFNNNIDFEKVNVLKYVYTTGSQKLYVNDVLNKETTFIANPTATNYTFKLFRVHQPSTGYNSQVNIYYCKVFNSDNTLVRHYIPARRNSDDVLGMYDIVTNTFFTNRGTGTFSGPPVLPCGYTRLEYIESSGTQYIDTGVYVDKNTEIETVAKTNGAGSQYLFGVSDKRFLICQRKADDCLTFYFGNQTTPSSAVGYADFHKIEIKKQSFYVDDISVGSFASLDNFSQTDTAYLFDAHNHDWVSDTGSKMKYLKMWQSGALVRDYIPAKDPDGVIGMYDSVSGNFFPNAETKYTQVEYLKSSGTQYIEDASFTTATSGAIEIKTKDLMPHTRFAGWGNGNNYLQVSVALATPNSETNFFPFCYSNSWNDVNTRQADIAAENVIRYEFAPGLQKLYVNGVFDRQGTISSSVSTYPFRLFKVSLDTSVLNGSGTIYYCKVFNDNGLVRHYIPVRRDSDGVLGMYDTTTRAFLQNVGTGTFTAGADLDTFPNSFIAGPEIASNNNNCQVVNINWGGLSEPEASGMCVYGETFTAPSTVPTADAGYKFIGWMPR